MFLRQNRSATPTSSSNLPPVARTSPKRPGYGRTVARKESSSHLTPLRRRSGFNANSPASGGAVRAKPKYANGDNPFASSGGSSAPGDSPSTSPAKELVDSNGRHNSPAAASAAAASLASSKRVTAPSPVPLSPGKPVLVLDMDETLCHTTFSPTHQTVTCRPYLDNFLEAMSEIYEVVVFTAGTREYANCVLDHMDTTRTLISRRFFRDSCRIMDGVYCKDLRKVVADVDPELKSVLIVDNIPENYMLQPDLGIPISDFFGEEEDTALLHLIPFLQDLAKQNIAGTTSTKAYLKTNMHRITSCLKEGYY